MKYLNEGEKIRAKVEMSSSILNQFYIYFYHAKSFFIINVTVLKSFKINCCFFESYIISGDYVYFA